MALSWAVRAATSRGCSNLLLTQQSRLSYFTVQNAPKIGMLQHFQTNNGISHRIPTPTIQTPIAKSYSSSAPVSASSGSHSTLWVAERALSVALIGLAPLAIAVPCKPLDVLFAVSMVAHTYWGFEAIIQDYVRELLFGSIAPKAAHGLLIAVMVATLGGLFYLIFNDIGLAANIRKLWAVKSKDQVAK
ncbi:succinate dehydrogenase, subunit D [Arctopsyche grandis]|uniref:succinate dehydrogenase, subunit D n=1 Tax=Arctopsyche grandis TaxID=121162 RepID=UPI00406D683E